MLQIHVTHYQLSILMIKITSQMKIKREIGKKYDPSNSFIKGYKYDEWQKRMKKKVNHSQKKVLLKK